MAVKSVEQRLTVVEHRVAENASRNDGLREAIAELGNRMDRRFEAMEQRFDRRFEAIDGRFEAIDRRFESIDRRFEAIDRRFDVVDGRFETIEQRFDTMDRRFLWLTGTLVATMLTLVSILSAALLGG
ncbi:MAG: hypothetical protein F4W89_13840 [Acidobacteria bacterium]|nr:hypothetical protein [Acidobacteriota bacterium]